MVKAGKPYGNMIIRMDMDTAQFTQSLTAIRRGSRNLRDEMKAVNNVFRGSGNEAKRLGEEFKVLERIMKQQEKEYQSLANRKRELEKQNKTETVQYTNIVQQMNRVTGSMARYENQIKQNRDANAKLNVEGRKLENTLKSTSAHLKSSVGLYKAQGNEVKALKTQQEGLKNQIKTINQLRQTEYAQLGKLKARFGAHSNEVRDQITKINTLKATQNEYTQSLKSMGSQLQVAANKQRLLETGFGRNLQALKRNKAAIIEVRNSLMSIGAVSTTMAYPMARAIGGSVRATVQWEEAFAQVRKTVNGATEQEFKQLDNSIMKMSKQIPETATNIAETMGLAAQLGIKGTKNLEGFTKVATQMGVATNMSIEDASTAMARFANVTGMKQSTKNFEKLGSTIVNLGNNMAAQESEISNFMLRLSGTGTTVGLAEKDIVALSAAMAGVGINAEAGKQNCPVIEKSVA